MCGIIAYLSKENFYSRDVHSALNNMLWIDTIRGDHSTGIIYQSEGQVEYYKKAVPGYDFVSLPIPSAVLGAPEKTRFIIGHNRAATLGSVNSANAHPFEFDHIVGVHNGTLYNHHSLTPTGVNHQVDSMHLYDAISREGSKVILPKVDGSFNLIWHDNSDNTIHICKNKDRPFTFAKIKGKDTMIGASEKAMLKWLLKRHRMEIEFCWDPENNVEYVFEQDANGAVIKYIEEIKHEAYVKPVITYPKTNNKYDNRNKGKVTTTKFGDKKPVEFYLDDIEKQSYLVEGKQNYTGYGETVEGVDVIVNTIFDDDEIDKDTWYEAEGWFREVTTNGNTVQYYTIEKASIKKSSATREEDDEVVHICQHCGEDSTEDQIVWIDNAPLCIECCDSFGVSEEWLDDPKEAVKLKVN